MPKFRKKPVVIEAVLYTGYNIGVVWDAFGAENVYGPSSRYSKGEGDDNIYIETLEGIMAANPGDWIIQGVAGEVYPCKPEIFEATYELVVE